MFFRVGLLAPVEAIDTDELMYIDGVALSTVEPTRLCAVDEEGNVLLIRMMSITQLRAELAARDLPTKGTKKEMARKVQVRGGKRL